MDAEVAPETIGRYVVIRQLGQGAMGRVLLAKDPVLDREVAIKLLRDDLKIESDQKAALIKRMRQEARASARVSHPNLVALHDMGEDDRRGLYLVFEYVKGATLKQCLTQGPLRAGAAARLAEELGGALTTAHRSGVLHRDIKPDNIILSATGAKIADFGIARVPDSTLTRDGGLLGTPAYSSPESIATGEFSPLSDQFSMAATLYEAISGTRAFPGQDAVAVATKISTEQPLPVAASRGLGPKVDEILSKALAKQPQARFASAAQFGDALAAALAESRARTNMPTIPDQRRAADDLPVQRGQVRRAALGGIAIGALLTIVAFRLTAQLKSPEPTSAAAVTASPSAEASSVRAGLTQRSAPVGWLAASPPKPKPRSSAKLTRQNSDAVEEPSVVREKRKGASQDESTTPGASSASNKAKATPRQPVPSKVQLQER